MRVHPHPVRTVVAALMLAALAACGRGQAPAPAKAPAPAPSAAPTAGYVAPPVLSGAERAAAVVTLRGVAPVGAMVRLQSPTGPALSASAGGDGRWALSLPLPAEPALFALSAEVGGRTVRAEGAVLLLPEPGPPALMVRAGFAALPLGAASARPVIVALDYDAGGGAAVAGLALPSARIRLSLDGVAAGLGQADEAGHFAVLAANRPLNVGTRRLQVESDRGGAEVRVMVSRPQPLDGQAYRAARLDGAWRIDWSPGGGGVQTTVVFDAAAPSASGTR